MSTAQDLLSGSTALQAERRQHKPTLPTLLADYANTASAIGAPTSAGALHHCAFFCLARTLTHLTFLLSQPATWT
jgi:hypothetical protein